MKKKISLKKRSLESLSDALMSKVEGGNVLWTTSFGSCTGSVCCSSQPKISEAYTTCLSDGELPTRPDC